MKLKKIMSFALACAMTVSLSANCFAAEATAVKGANEDPVNTEKQMRPSALVFQQSLLHYGVQQPVKLKTKP